MAALLCAVQWSPAIKLLQRYIDYLYYVSVSDTSTSESERASESE